MNSGNSDDHEREARLASLRTRFATGLDAKVTTILTHAMTVRVGPWPGTVSEELLTEVHGLAGSAGLFGQERIGDAAAAIERLLIGFARRKTVTAVDLAQLREAARKLEIAYAAGKDAS
jgi:hypothetical protein